MGHKIFISYKYGDSSVEHLPRNYPWEITKVRDYVDEFQEKLTETDHINKGEIDGESLANFKDSTIASKLRDKIYDSTVTVVFISPNMKESYIPEDDQWIPWEVAYSLREATRKDRTSRRNAVLAVVLPDINGSYSYMLEPRNCCVECCTTWHRFKLFRILSLNMFNRKVLTKANCANGESVYSGYPSYIQMFRWAFFIKNIDYCISIAESIREEAEHYEVRINV